jgi:acyl-CoA synthetase (AMP-forming)/AMP-acid ligase II
LAGAVRALAADLAARGIKPGDHVAIFLDKTLDAPVALYGTWCAGAVAVPINEGLRSGPGPPHSGRQREQAVDLLTA